MIVASGTSDRHLHALAGKIHDDSKAAGHPPLGIEGEDSRDWVLVDLGDIIVHLMRPETRELYSAGKTVVAAADTRLNRHRRGG